MLQQKSAPSPFDLTANYDRLRLSIYQARGSRSRHITIKESGGATFLRFDDVGYFNRVYSRSDDIGDRFDEIDDFFRDSPFGCRLVSPALKDDGPLPDACRRRGWIPDEAYAWLSGNCYRPAPQDRRLVIRGVDRVEAETFFRTYLMAFDAAPDRIPAAIENMRHLFDEPALHFLLALVAGQRIGGQPVGVGMLHHVGEAALLCAGAITAEHRGLGGHEALVAARLELAHTLGCSSVHSWAICGGRSHRTLERMGLKTVAATRSWRRLPQALK
jgi:GNAT superfamily N-acetyltransferase